MTASSCWYGCFSHVVRSPLRSGAPRYTLVFNPPNCLVILFHACYPSHSPGLAILGAPLWNFSGFFNQQGGMPASVMLLAMVAAQPPPEAAVAEQQTATALSAEAKQWTQLRSADDSKALQAPAISGWWWQG